MNDDETTIANAGTQADAAERARREADQLTAWVVAVYEHNARAQARPGESAPHMMWVPVSADARLAGAIALFQILPVESQELVGAMP